MRLRTCACWLLLSAASALAQAPQSVETGAATARQWVDFPARAATIHGYGAAGEIRNLAYQVPRPLRVWVVTIDTGASGVRFAVTQPAEESEERGRYETRCSSTLEFARQRGVQLAINASAFGPYRARAGGFMDVVGLAAVRGQLYSEADERFGAMYISREGRVALKGPPLPTEPLWHVVPGFRMLLDDGRVVVQPAVAESSFGGVNPRTAVGVDRAGRTLWIVVVDGRQPGVSEGITLIELAALFQWLGAWDALNLDGGGSTTLVAEQDDGTHGVINTPVGQQQPNTLRQVANNVGLYLPGPRPAASQETAPTMRAAVVRLAAVRRGGGYKWVGGGVSRDVVYEGKTILQASDDGTYCCGATLELFLDAYCLVHHDCDRAAASGRWFMGWPVDRLVALQQGWYGTPAAVQCPLFPENMRATVRERQVVDALTWARLAEPVGEYRLLERGDFVQFWRTSGSGHSAVFWGRDYDAQGRERLWYWSSQPNPRRADSRTPGEDPPLPGLGMSWEYVGEEIDPQRIYGARLTEPDQDPVTTRPTTSAVR